jgi:hypothetical protein
LSSTAEIRKQLEQNWIQFLRENSASLSIDHIDGSSPPSVFVGSYGYPKVRVGPMIPPMHGDTSIMDKSELWAGRGLVEIANYRLSLVRGVTPMNVLDTTGRYVENLQDLAMSDRPVESEATFERQPITEIEHDKEVRLNAEAAPFGPAAPIRSFKTSSMSADQRIESAYYDKDLTARNAVFGLYESGVEVSRIHRVLSIGMLGTKKARRLVPTRWSITATDDIISKKLVQANDTSESIDLFEVNRYSHLSNFYSVILLPDDVWSFEMIEAWFTANGGLGTGADYEDSSGLDHYPTIAGAYFAARLAVAEHLSRRRRKAAALVVREIHPEYIMPLGVWQIREGVREALKNPPATFDTLANALSFAYSGLSVSAAEILGKSRLWRNRHDQLRMTDFAEFPKGHISARS